MKAARRASLTLAVVALALCTSVRAKGTTARIVISGGNLSRPIEMRDAEAIEPFQIWQGPGTRSCANRTCAEGTEGFIVDWTAGPVSDRPSGLQRYEVSFYVANHLAPDQPAREQLAYVVSYERDPGTSDGYVYLPGRDDPRFTLNVRSISRGGREGNWFHATRAWQEAVTPLLAHTAAR